MEWMHVLADDEEEVREEELIGLDWFARAVEGKGQQMRGEEQRREEVDFSSAELLK